MRLDKNQLSDKYQTKISFMKYHAMILHECANLQQNEKCATQICRSKVRIAESLCCETWRLLLFVEYQSLTRHNRDSLEAPSTEIRQISDKNCKKRGDVNALHTSSEFNLYTMSYQLLIGTKIGIFPELQIILLARVFKGVNQDFQDCAHCDTLFS